MHTGDGIERAEVSTDSLLTPVGGEGGSVLQALGSKAEERAKRRKKKKDSYAKYLEGPVWKKIRAAALKRDKHKCRACGDRARVVHHIRYPKNLGEEKMEWLYSLCAPCHDAIHRAAGSMTLKAATNLILTAGREENVTRLPDDWKLSRSATRSRHSKNYTRKNPSRTPKKKRRQRKLSPHVAADQRKANLISSKNQELHEVQKRAKLNRELRKEEREAKAEIDAFIERSRK